MDFDEPDHLLSNKPSRAEQAKAKHGRKKGKPVAKPASMNYDGISDISDDDSEGSKLYSRGTVHRDINSCREERRRDKVKQQLQQSQNEQLAQRKRDQRKNWEKSMYMI